MAVVIVLLVVIFSTLGLLAALLFALTRHLKLLAESVRRFQEEVNPVLERITEGSSSAQSHLGKLSESGARGLGDRIRP